MTLLPMLPEKLRTGVDWTSGKRALSYRITNIAPGEWVINPRDNHNVVARLSRDGQVYNFWSETGVSFVGTAITLGEVVDIFL